MRTNTEKGDMGTYYLNLLWEALIVTFKDYLKAKVLCNGNTICEELQKATREVECRYGYGKLWKRTPAYLRKHKRKEILANGLDAEKYIFDGNWTIGENITFDVACNYFNLDPAHARKALSEIKPSDARELLEYFGYSRKA